LSQIDEKVNRDILDESSTSRTELRVWPTVRSEDSILSNLPAKAPETDVDLRRRLYYVKKVEDKLKRVVERHIDRNGVDGFEKSQLVLTNQEMI